MDKFKTLDYPIAKIDIRCQFSEPLNEDSSKLLHEWLDYLIARNMLDYSCTVILTPENNLIQINKDI